MHDYGGGINTHTHYAKPYDPSSPVPTKALNEVLVFVQLVSTAGSIFNLSITDNLNLIQSYSDFFHEIILDPISFVQPVTGPVDRINSITDSLAVTDSFVFAGGLGGGSSSISAIFDSNTSKGMAIYVSGDGNVDLAKANTASTSTVIGLSNDDVLSGATGSYLTEGQIDQADWSAVTGTVSLTPGAVYFLSEVTAGLLTTTPPNTSGDTIVRVGRALTATIMDIEVAQPILL